jgi:hypothetical protein
MEKPSNGRNVRIEDLYLQRVGIGELDIHEECKNRCRSSILLKYIELYPESLAQPNNEGDLPLHVLLWHEISGVDAFRMSMMMIEKYPAALEHRNVFHRLPIHNECYSRCRSAIISKCINLYPESLARGDGHGDLPWHALLQNMISTTEDALLMIEKYPVALEHRNVFHRLPIHNECYSRCRSAIISKCIDLYPESLARGDGHGDLPLQNMTSTAEDALMMMQKYPTALRHKENTLFLPIHMECRYRCRAAIIAKCIELYPECMDTGNSNLAIYLIVKNSDSNSFRRYSPALAILFTIRPMSLYQYPVKATAYDRRKDPGFRRRVLNLLPRHVFTPTHCADYRDLNWQPRAAMMMLVSQIKLQQQSRQQQQGSSLRTGRNGNTIAILAESLLHK